MTNTNTVFIVSQPRAGSTLLQTLLGGHADVFAPGEAWLMLPLVHAIAGSRRNVSSPYDQTLADDAIGEFLQHHLPGGWNGFSHAVGQTAQRIYAAAREHAGARVLIDKTPRYYWIIEDLLEMLPECRIILLVRNPLAVLSSIMETWTRRKRVGFLKDYRGDLLEAPARIAAAMSLEEDRICTVRYEDLIGDTERKLDQLQRFIGVEPTEGLHRYQADTTRMYGDPNGIHRHHQPTAESMEKYLRLAARRATHWRLLDDYRRFLGPDMLAKLGYCDQELQRQLDAVRPVQSFLAPPLADQTRPRPAEPKRSYLRARRMIADAFDGFRRAA